MEEGIKIGIKEGFKFCLNLAKIIVPVTFTFAIIKETTFFKQITFLLSPYMEIMGLPGSAAFTVLLGFFSLYAAVGSILPLGLTVKETTIVAMMLLTAHTLIIEGGVLKQLKLNYIKLTAFRILMAFFIGIIINFLM
jgi:spore maturation protein SpmB